MDEIIKEYIAKICSEKESLVARYIEHTRCKPDEICLVERETPNGRIIYPDLKNKYGFPEGAT